MVEKPDCRTLVNGRKLDRAPGADAGAVEVCTVLVDHPHYEGARVASKPASVQTSQYVDLVVVPSAVVGSTRARRYLRAGEPFRSH